MIDSPHRVNLTVRNVPTLAAELGLKTLWWDRGLPGFYVLVSPPSVRYPEGVRSFGVWYRLRRKGKRVSLGRHPVVTLAEARGRARQILVAAKVYRRDKAPGPAAPANLAELLETWIEATTSEKTGSTIQQYNWMLESTVRPSPASALPLDDLRREDLRQLVAPALARAPSVALHVRTMIKAAFAWALREDVLDRDPSVGWRPPAHAESRERVLHDDEVVTLWKATEAERGRGRYGVQRAALARLLLLLAQRSGETAAMRWQDLDQRGKVWLIPGEFRKGKRGKRRAHAVPLSDQVLAELELLRPVTGDDERVMPWADAHHRHWVRPLKHRAAALGLAVRWTPHDLRRTAATGMARLGTSRSVIALILGHEMHEGGAVSGVYDRYDRMPERAAALGAWAAHVERLVVTAPR